MRPEDREVMGEMLTVGEMLMAVSTKGDAVSIDADGKQDADRRC